MLQNCRHIIILSILALFPCHNALADLQWHIVASSDYVLKGISQTDEDASLQGGLNYSHASGFFTGMWLAQNALFKRFNGEEGDTLEIDYYAGYQFQTDNEQLWTATAYRYSYPQGRFDEYSYNELTISTSFNNGFSGTAGFNDNLYHRNKHSNFIEFAYETALSRETSLHLGLGHKDLDRLFNFTYYYWSIGGSYSTDYFTFDLTHIDTSSNATNFFGDKVAGPRWMLNIIFDF